MLRIPLAATTPPIMRAPRTRIDLLLWILLVFPVVHVGLLHLISDLNDLEGIAVQALRPLGTTGAALVLLYVGTLNQGHRRVAWLLMAVSIFFSAVYSTVQVVFNTSVMVGYMRALWVIVYASALAGAIAYVPPRSWLSLQRVANALRVVVSCIAVGCSAFVVLYSALVLYNPALPFDILRPTSLTVISIDITFLFANGLMRKDHPIFKFLVLCTLCVLITDVIQMYMIIRFGFYAYQGRTLITSPLYTFQSITLALAAYHDTIFVSQRETARRETTVKLREWLIWMLTPLELSLAAFILMIVSHLPIIPPLLVLLSISAITHTSLAAYDYHRALRNQQLATIREQHVRELMRYFQHELLGYIKALNGLMPILRTSLPSSTGDRSLAESEPTLNVMDATIGQLDDLVKELLLISRDGLLVIPAPVPIALKPLVDQIGSVTAYRPEIQVSIDAPDEDVFVYGNALYLSLAIKTALRNALEALDQLPTARPGQLTLTLVTTEQRAFLHLEDSGPGFSSEVLERLEHLRATRQPLTPGWSTKTSGYGLGLALIDRIVALHGGSWECGNLPNGCGAWIEIILPRWSPATKPAHAAEWTAPRTYP